MHTSFGIMIPVGKIMNVSIGTDERNVVQKWGIIKRDGRTVEYDRNKILIAIRKANAEVDTFERVNDDMIDGIVAGIENMKRDTMQVEDIQDILSRN